MLALNKITKLTIFNLILFACVVGVCVAELLTGFIGMNAKEFCVLCFLGAVAISLMVRGVFFKSSNSVWFALIVFSYMIFLLLSIYYGVLIDFYASAFLILPAVFAIPTGLIFKEMAYFKIAIFLSFICVPVLMFNFKIIGALLFVLLLVAFGICGYFLQMLIKVKRGDEN